MVGMMVELGRRLPAFLDATPTYFMLLVAKTTTEKIKDVLSPLERVSPFHVLSCGGVSGCALI